MKPIKLSIGETADLLGISAKTIRHYHEIDLIPEPERLENGYRVYGLRELRQIQTVRRLQGYGLSLKQIQVILNSDAPDRDLRAFVIQRDTELAETIDQLQRQQARIRAALKGDSPADDLISSRAIIQSVMHPAASYLTDVLLQVEAVTLDELDRSSQQAGYAAYWEHAAHTLSQRLIPHEHQVILWLERYLAAQAMETEDKQAQAWLIELQTNSVGSILLGALELPRSPELPTDEQTRIERLLPLLIHDHASPLQRLFLEVVLAHR